VVQVRWKEGKTLESEGGSMMESGLLGVRSGGKQLDIWAEFGIWRVAL